jgi:beta-fructofuranosidase
MSIVLLLLAVGSLFHSCSNETKAKQNKKTGLSAEKTTKDIAAQRDLRELILSDPHRPIYHFVNPEGRGMPFDPNGAIFWKGKFHLFYIFQDHRGHCWGHASSKDLLHWRLHTTALYPGENDVDYGIFSGNCFINNEGEAIMLYHGVKAGNCIATSNETELDNWIKLPSNPIIPIPEENSPEDELYSSWDPHGWVENDTYYAIFGGPNPAIFTAKNLDDWKYKGPFMTREMPDVDDEHEDVSCPDFFKLGNKHALLCISHERGARIYFGEWKNDQFHPEKHQRMNWSGGTCFAPESMLDDKGRRIMWAWVLDRREKLHIRDLNIPPPYGWSGTMTLPRVLSLDKDGTLLIEPVEELNQLRMSGRNHQDLVLKSGESFKPDDISGNSIELSLTIEPGSAKSFGLKVLKSPDGEEETVISYNPDAGQLTIDFEKSSLDKSIKHYEMCMNFRENHENPVVTKQVAPFKLNKGEKIEIRIYIDKSILEVFINSRQCVTQRIYPTREDSRGIELFSKGGAITIESLQAWDMAATNFY